ncbi:hypothetical protein CVD28_12410 [Bacillus sp. M6-12]|uniref:hypothetical protein n=1 Tax=Bacillus sp. M6-12 TaxID=2054166 RepID=UPI000C766952|nr:hypothetical protein [Bacillus sp. M6-12]PLS17362.1 hypothetical protein CVD28_12410 [Bacillus sp. M6-12]
MSQISFDKLLFEDQISNEQSPSFWKAPLSCLFLKGMGSARQKANSLNMEVGDFPIAMFSLIMVMSFIFLF